MFVIPQGSAFAGCPIHRSLIAMGGKVHLLGGNSRYSSPHHKRFRTTEGHAFTHAKNKPRRRRIPLCRRLASLLSTSPAQTPPRQSNKNCQPPWSPLFHRKYHKQNKIKSFQKWHFSYAALTKIESRDKNNGCPGKDWRSHLLLPYTIARKGDKPPDPRQTKPLSATESIFWTQHA